MHILFAGGGTAGHINPALAVAGLIKEKQPDAKISYIGTENHLEAKLVPQAGYDFYTIDVVGLKRSLSPKNIGKNIVAVKKAVVASMKVSRLLKELKPDVVVGTGGYVSGPVLREAAKLGIKTAIHEQNAFPGITTKMLSGKVDTVMLAMREAEKHLKLNKKPVVTGNPVRIEFLKPTSREEARKKLGLSNEPMILSFGGSLGARPINEAVTELMISHASSGKYIHFHSTGSQGYERTVSNLKAGGVDLSSSKLRVSEYITDMADCMVAADLIIGRAGAITLSEICAVGRASILIPSPYVAENHQFHNAMTLKNNNAAEVIEEKDLTGETLIRTVDKILGDGDTAAQMGKNAAKASIPDANERIYNCITELIN